MTSQTTRYTAPGQLLHWLTLLLLVGSYSLGWVMTDLKLSPTKLQLFSYHKWIGVTVFLLVLLRVLWRLASPPPPLPAGMPRWQVLVAEYTHRLLYLLLFVVPLSGWLMSSAHGFQTVYLGVLPIPDLLAKNHDLAETLEEVHESLTVLMLSVVALHALAALKHHFIDRDDILRRMLPFGGSR